MGKMMKGVARYAGKRAAAMALAALMLISMLPIMWPAVSASELESAEHIHSDDCRGLICTLEEEGHIHSDGCYETACVNEEPPVQTFALVGPVRAADQTAPTVSGVWDYGTSSANENIRFGSGEAATITHSNVLESETVTVRITASFPEGATDKKLRITLGEGLVWHINGEDNIPETSLKSVSALSGESTVYGQKLGNGSYTYSFVDGVETVDIEIMVKKSIMTNFETISDAIVAEASCTYPHGTKSASSSLETLRPQQVETVTVANNKFSAYAKPDMTVFIVGSPLNITTYTSGSGVSHKRLYDYVEMTIEAPSNISLVTGANAHPGTSVSTTALSGWELKSQETVGDVTTYVFRKEKLFTASIGITPEWNIPSSEYEPDDTVVIKAKKIEWKLYGDDNICSRSGTGTHTYKVVDPNKRNEIVTSGTYRHSLQYRTDSPDAVYQLTGWSLRNTGTDPSAPKIVEFEFDTENIGVTDVTIVAASGQKITTVWYKLKGDTEWREKKVNLSGKSSLGGVLVSNVSLGLDEDDYFAAFKYELDFVDNNGTASDTSDDFRYGIAAGATSTAYNPVYVPIAGVYLGPRTAGTTATSYVRVYDKTAEGETIQADTGKVAIRTVYSETTYNYLQVDSTQQTKASAGTTFHFSASISATWRSSTSFPYCVSFTHYPIIYIRDETGEGIANVQLINSDGVDILSQYSDYVKVEYSHTETTDYNGDGKLAAVYRIDTRGLSALPDAKDNYAAAVGVFEADGVSHKLTLNYTVTPPSTYGDGQVLHYMRDAIMLSDPSATSSSNRNKALEYSDPYDVNGDGALSGMGVLKPTEAVVKGYYMIISRADISVSAGVKKESDSEYTKWDGTGDYFPVEPDTVYDVNFGVFNGSGNPTGTDPDKITYVYIPIPKKGEEWGTVNSGTDEDGTEISEFGFTANLTEPIKNPSDTYFDIEYAVVDTSAFGETTDSSVVGTALRNGSVVWGDYSKDANCIRIALKGMPSGDLPENFTLKLEADAADTNKGETNIIRALYFEDITDDQNRRYTGWFTSDAVAVQITWGEISGRLWEDLNGNGVQDANEPAIVGETVTLTGAAVRKTETCTTDSDGGYSFAQIPSGEYSVTVDFDTDEYSLSPKDAGGNDSLDSDASAVGSTAKIGGIVLPYSDSMGKQTYDYGNADIGLVPRIDVDYSWDGDIPADAQLPGGERLTAGISYTAHSVADIIGYTFKGWFVDSALSEKYMDGSVLLEDLTLYGEWEVNEYTITFDTDGGNNISPITQDYGTPVTAPADPVRVGHSFVGWDRTVPATMPAGDMTVTAQWKVNEYTITFDTAGGSDISPITQDYGTPVTAPADPVRTGYTFVGWDKTVPSTMPAQNVTVTAQWKINEYDITYNAVGEKPDGAQTPEGVTVDWNTAYTAQTPADVSGWLFDGWYTDSGLSNKFADGTAITDDTDLYGRWIDNTVTVSGTVTWKEVPPELEIPTVTVDLMLDGEVVESIELAPGETEFSFDNVKKYAAVGGQPLDYTVRERDVAGYAVTYSVSEKDGDMTVDITNTGDFERSSLVIGNFVIGEDAPDAQFIYTVTFDSDLEYSYDGTFGGTVKSGDTITLGSGESITIDGLLVGTVFTVTQNEVENFVTSPSREIEGVISSAGSSAQFTNKFELPPVGNLEISNAVTGSAADTSVRFPFRVEFDAVGSYTSKIVGSDEELTIASGGTIELAHGEKAIIYGLPVGANYMVTQTETNGYKVTSTGASGIISLDGSSASFINELNGIVAGDHDSPQTGDTANVTEAVFVMQLALMLMALCLFMIRKPKQEE